MRTWLITIVSLILFFLVASVGGGRSTFGQSIVVSSGGQSIVVSSHADSKPVVTTPVKKQKPKPVTIRLPDPPPVVESQPVIVAPQKPMAISHAEMVALHNDLHGGGSRTWPGDLATHLETAHGVQTATPVVIQRKPVTRVQSSCPGGVCPTNRQVHRRNRGFLFWRR